MTDKKEEIYCKLCNYKTIKTSDWLKHLNSQKHLRNGEKKTTKCDCCEYESTTHWNIKAHKLKIHSTKEIRSQQKYYCDLCDIVFFCKTYMDKHNAGKVHQNKIKIQETLKEIEIKYEEKIINNK
jgi:hypothetical protein